SHATPEPKVSTISFSSEAPFSCLNAILADWVISTKLTGCSCGGPWPEKAIAKDKRKGGNKQKLAHKTNRRSLWSAGAWYRFGSPLATAPNVGNQAHRIPCLGSLQKPNMTTKAVPSSPALSAVAISNGLISRVSLESFEASPPQPGDR